MNSWALGAAVLAVSAALRFTHLDYGLRHEVAYDERIFVQNALDMLARGDWDHRFYEYPGLLLWILRVVLGLTGAAGAEAYWVSRALIAFASTATVLLVFVVASAWTSRRAGFLAALLLALSPVDIETAHMLRPDAMIAPLLFAALVFLAPRNGESSPRVAWLLATMATAIKFSAGIVFVPLFVAALVAKARFSEIAKRCLGALALFAVLSPHTFLGGAESIAGMQEQVAYHYDADRGEGFASTLKGLLSDTLPRALSWPGLGLSAWGLALGLRSRSQWALAWILFVGVWIAVFSTTGARYGRFMVPVLGALCLLAALGLEDLLTRMRFVVWPAAAMAVILLALGAHRYVSALAEPLTLDQAVDWIREHPALEDVGSVVLGLGDLDRGGPEIVPLRGFRGESFLASQFDALVLPGGEQTPQGFEEVKRFAPLTIYNGPPLAIFRALSPRRFSALDLEIARIQTSVDERDSRLKDGLLSTRWRSDVSPAFIIIEWPAAVSPTRVELAFGAIPPERELGVKITDDSGTVVADSVRAPLKQQRSTPTGRPRFSRGPLVPPAACGSI